MKIDFPALPASNFDVGDLLNSLIRAQNKKPWTRREGVYHPSSISKCRRNLYYDRTSMPPKPDNSDDMLNIFGLGHAIHGWLQNVLREHAGFTDEALADVVPLYISGNTDGIFRVENWILEFKTVSRDIFSRTLRPQKEHVMQIHCYMAALRVPRAQVVYINRDSGHRRMFRVMWDDAIWAEIEAIVADVEAAVIAKKIPDREVEFMECRECKFKYVCEPFEATNGRPARRTSQGPVRPTAGDAGNGPGKHWVQSGERTTWVGAAAAKGSVVAAAKPATRTLRRLSSILRVPDGPTD